MSIIITNGCDCAEKELLNNWAAEYSKRAIEDHKTAEIIDHPDGSVTADKIKDGAVSSSKIASGAVGAEKIASGAVTEAKIADYAVTVTKLAIGSVNNNRIVNDSVDTRTIADSAVTTDKVKDGAITENKLADYSVTTTRIAQGAVNNRTLADGAVTESKIADRSITAFKIADGAIIAQHLSPKSINGDKIMDYVVDDNNLVHSYVKSDIFTTDTSQGLKQKTDPKYIELRELTAQVTPGDTGIHKRSYYLNTEYNDREEPTTYVWSELLTEDNVRSKIPNGVIDPDKTSFCTYTETRQKVGTWIDGKSIYRIAFDHTFTDDEKSQIKKDNYWNAASFMSDVDSNIDKGYEDTCISLINCSVRGKDTTMTAASDVIAENTGGLLFNISSQMIEDYSCNGVFGWIEYVILNEES